LISNIGLTLRYPSDDDLEKLLSATKSKMQRQSVLAKAASANAAKTLINSTS